MLEAVSSIQRVVDLLGVGRLGGRVCLARRLSSVLVCGVAALLLVGATSASAVKFTEAERERLAAKNLELPLYTEPYKELAEVCAGKNGTECSTSEFSLPAGVYLQKNHGEGEDIWAGYGVVHTGIYCENAYTLKNCNPYEYYTGAPFSIVGEVPGMGTY
jgi:hypothetical protein